MSQEKQKSTLFTLTEPLKCFESVIALGKRLVEELGMEPGVDTLGRWMAHYVAGLIRKAEETNDPDEHNKAWEKCCETVLRLWKHRSSLPRGVRPLANLEGVLEAIENIFGKNSPWPLISNMEVERIGSPWMLFARIVEEAGLRMCRIAVLTAIAEVSLDKENCWLQEHGEMMSEEEIRVVKILDNLLSGEMLWQTRKDRVSVGDLEPHERTSRVLEEIMALIEQLKSSFEILQSKVQD